MQRHLPIAIAHVAEPSAAAWAAQHESLSTLAPGWVYGHDFDAVATPWPLFGERGTQVKSGPRWSPARSRLAVSASRSFSWYVVRSQERASHRRRLTTLAHSVP